MVTRLRHRHTSVAVIADAVVADAEVWEGMTRRGRGPRGFRAVVGDAARLRAPPEATFQLREGALR